LAAILRDAASVWADRTKREGVNFKLEIEADEVLVNSDGTRVRQIIDNLAENALRVTPAESVIVFALSADAVLQVRDGGPGLSADDQAVAFAPGELYERYKGVRRVGTGFGLALVGGLAKRLGAKASVGNAPEGGAAFSIAFAKAE
jgi:two-component system sensor histidine kinase BaeS